MTIPAFQTYFIQQAPLSSDLALSACNSVAQLGLAVGSGIGGLIISLVNTSYFNPWNSAVIIIFTFIIAYVVLTIPKNSVAECGNY